MDEDLPYHMGNRDIPSAQYPRYVVRMYAGELHLCIQTKRLLGVFKPKSVRTRMIGSHYYYLPAYGPARPSWAFDLLPVDDSRPHWTLAAPRKRRSNK